MQKELVDGIPYWKDKSNNVYSFEPDKKNLIVIGSYNSEKKTVTLKPNWKELYQTKLDEYRKNLKNRERKENKLETK